MIDGKPTYIPVADPAAAALSGRCPRCGEGRLFSGFVSIKPSCSVCGLDFGFADSADGPAVFIMLIAGFLVLGLVLVVEVAYQPPIWLHMVVFLPLAVAVSLGLMRPLKGWFIGQQFRNKAAEGRLES